MNHLWDCGIFLDFWAGLGGFGSWERRNKKKLMRKIKLIQGWSRMGNTKYRGPGKGSPNHQISTESWPKNADKQGPLRIPGLTKFGLSSQL
jgi:hypothetical protein